MKLALHNRKGDIVAYTLVDLEDYQLLKQYRWRLGPNNSAARGKRTNGKYCTFLIHRVIMGLDHDDPREVDHKNRNRLDNRRKNLRIVTRLQNAQNVPHNKTWRGQITSSRYRGVRHHSAAHMAKRPNGRPWFVMHTLNGKNIKLGTYWTEEEANEAAIQWRKENMLYAID